jgi:threonine dehydratase
MRGYGAELIEHGADFDDALEYSKQLAAERRLHTVPSFDPMLVTGVATYALELLRSVEDLHTVYVPIGLGSGICGMIAMRDALGLATQIVGVVAKGAPTYALSFARGEVVATAETSTIADGLAVRSPDPWALEIIRRGVDRIVVIDDDEIRAAMNHLYTDTHNLAEGAGAATLAAVLQEREIVSGRRAAIVLTGSNIDREKYLQIIGGSA